MAEIFITNISQISTVGQYLNRKGRQASLQLKKEENRTTGMSEGREHGGGRGRAGAEQ